MAGLKNIGEDLGRSIIGSPKSALLMIHDYRGAEAKTNKLPGTVKKISEKLSTFGSSAAPSKLEGGYSRKVFKVQFNPKELSLYVHNKPMEMIDLQEEKGDSQTLTQTSLPPMVDLTVPLVFDDVNIYDSFMLDKYTMGASASTVTNAATMIAAMAGKKWTVQPQVEGLVAALRNPKTRKVTFRWADFTFTGHLNAVTAQYTMFNTSGRPVRAQVQLRIRQTMHQEFIQQWTKEFDEAFGGDSSSMMKKTQHVGNILNINL